MHVRIATGIYVSPTKNAVRALRIIAFAGLVSLAAYTGFSHYGSLKNDKPDFSPDTAKANFYMKEVMRAKLPAEEIIKK